MFDVTSNGPPPGFVGSKWQADRHVNNCLFPAAVKVKPTTSQRLM